MKDTWEYIQEFIKKFGHFPKDQDELIVCVDYVINHMNEDRYNEGYDDGYKHADYVNDLIDEICQ